MARGKGSERLGRFLPPVFPRLPPGPLCSLCTFLHSEAALRSNLAFTLPLNRTAYGG